MTLAITELVKSREQSGGANPSMRLKFTISGTSEESVALAYLKAQTLIYLIVDGKRLTRNSMPMSPIGDVVVSEMWFGEANYTKQDENQEAETPSKYSFSISGQSEKKLISLETTGSYTSEASGSGAEVPDFKQFIGVTPKGDIQGVSIIKPVYTFGLSQYLEFDTVDEPYRNMLRDLVGTINDATFRGSPAGEVRLDGVDGNLVDDVTWELSYRFSERPNQTNVTVGDMIIAEIKGWEYLWVFPRRTVQVVGGKKRNAQVPHYAFVEKVYSDGDFSLLGLNPSGS